MQLIDIKYRKQSLSSEEGNLSYFVKFEMKDLLYSLKTKGDFTYEEMKTKLDSKMETFKTNVAKVEESLTAHDLKIEEIGDERCSVDEFGKINVTIPVAMQGETPLEDVLPLVRDDLLKDGLCLRDLK